MELEESNGSLKFVTRRATSSHGGIEILAKKDVVLKYAEELKNETEKRGFHPFQLLNMDETGLWLQVVRHYTITKKWCDIIP